MVMERCNTYCVGENFGRLTRRSRWGGNAGLHDSILPGLVRMIARVVVSDGQNDGIAH